MAQVQALLGAPTLALGRSESPEIFSIDTFTNYTSSDYNGFRPNPEAEFSFDWISPPFSTAADYTAKREQRRFKTLQDYSKATGQDTHSLLVDYDVFENLRAPDAGQPHAVYHARDLNFRLKPGGKAVDAGMLLPNVNDGFTGKAPDLGAWELDRPVPVYGPRTKGAKAGE